MIEAARYRVIETLGDGRQVVIRAQRQDDRPGFRAALKRASAETLYHRFFAAKHDFTDEEVAHYFDIDFVNHVALLAEVEEQGRPTLIGGGRYIVTEPGRAEVAFSLIDEYQGLGIGTMLLRHLADLARRAGLREFFAEVLTDNAAMLRVFEHSGLVTRERREGTIVEVTMSLAKQSVRTNGQAAPTPPTESPTGAGAAWT